MGIGSVLQLVSVIGEITVLLLLIRNSVWRTLPLFCTYIGWALISDIATFGIQRYTSPETYFRFGTIELIVDSLLQFAVLVELAWSVLTPVRSSLPRKAIFVLAGAIALAGLIIWPLAGKTLPLNLGPESRLFFHLQETFAVLRVACFVVMASFSSLLSIGWRDRELQIATGFGFYSIVSLIVAVLHSHQSPGTLYNNLETAETVSYLGTLSYWVFSFATSVQKRKEFSPQMQQFLLLMGGGARSNRVALTNMPHGRFKDKD